MFNSFYKCYKMVDDKMAIHGRNALMLSVLAALRLLKIGDANGAELALLGGPAVLL